MWPFRTKDAIPSYDVANTIGRGSSVRGDLAGPGGFRIDGRVAGEVDGDGPVMIGEEGVVDGAVRGCDVVVLGCVRGDIRATGHLEIGPKGRVLGDITVQSFLMHKGGVFRGTSRMAGGDDGVPALLEHNESAVALVAHRGRTLPPPMGTGAVPPPPSLAELAAMTPGSASETGTTTGIAALEEAAESHERLVVSDAEQPRRATAG